VKLFEYLFIYFGAFFTLASCATLTGIPGHGGGKRFSEEQRLVSSSIRLAVRHIDIASLRGKNAAIVFGLIADEGGGNIVGGRASITAVLTQGQVTVPTNTSRSTVDIFQVANGSSSTATSSTTGATSSTTSGTTTGSSNTNSSSTSNSTTTGTSTAETTSQFSTNANQTTDTTSSSTTNGTGTGTSTTTTSEIQNGSSTGSNTSSTTQNGSTTGTSEQAIVTGTTTSASGEQSQANIGITYEGLGQYQNLAVPKPDAAFLMSEVRNHFLLNGIHVRSPADPSAEVFVYVSVPILGTNRSRTDLLVYNQESLRAETYIEIFAIDRTGRIIMQPQVGNFQTYYKEDYVAWSGPYNTRRGSESGAGLIGEIGETRDGRNIP